MPELPEVERARRMAEKWLQGRSITRVATVDDRIVYEGVTPRRFACALRGKRVESVERRGKYIFMRLNERPWPVFHFGMTGAFEVYSDPADRPRFWKLELLTEDGMRLAMRNARRLGRIRLQEDPARLGEGAELRARGRREIAQPSWRRHGGRCLGNRWRVGVREFEDLVAQQPVADPSLHVDLEHDP